MAKSEERQILFFDGVCNLCNGFVDFVVSHDPENLFAFAPLQGSTAARTLPARMPAELRSVVLWNQGELHEKSDAALMVIQQLGGIWNLARIFWIFPKFIRDLGYDLIAKNRYRIFGKRDSCRLPTKEERARFLD